MQNDISLHNAWKALEETKGKRKFCQSIFAISQLSPLGKGRGPSFEQTWIPFTQGCFVPSLVEISLVVLEKKLKMWKVYRRMVKLVQVLQKKIFNCCQYILLFHSYLPMKGHCPSFEQTWIPSIQGCFVPSLDEIGLVVLEKKSKMWKVYRRMHGQTNRRTDRQTTDDRSEKLELSALVS